MKLTTSAENLIFEKLPNFNQKWQKMEKFFFVLKTSKKTWNFDGINVKIR